MLYKVKWVIDIDADTHNEAAKKAFTIQRDPNSTATVFEVSDEINLTKEIDLLEINNDGWYIFNYEDDRRGRSLSKWEFEFKDNKTEPIIININKFVVGSIESVLQNVGYSLNKESNLVSLDLLEDGLMIANIIFISMYSNIE